MSWCTSSMNLLSLMYRFNMGMCIVHKWNYYQMHNIEKDKWTNIDYYVSIYSQRKYHMLYNSKEKQRKLSKVLDTTRIDYHWGQYLESNIIDSIFELKCQANNWAGITCMRLLSWTQSVIQCIWCSLSGKNHKYLKLYLWMILGRDNFASKGFDRNNILKNRSGIEIHCYKTHSVELLSIANK